ncbi:twin-arginine translocation pathway signal protein [Bradyrhizobium sp. NAS80.1]|uniref:xanthine dehydrogenase family protein molybdopterin-binding subunit n=1 Tax=Bradyrhizobium sp. NAS80.1 TaxID=1680159 RepID=UPI00095EFB18|nr:xanthine dehydrogenase family protein molybdopterin-binding subunit [Bradyrhizobium sp. NAS80.1]OKO82284.1 twin-arginine translocation pathway signal protein [Bradyrhizobium sp. NAS80.1]
MHREIYMSRRSLLAGGLAATSSFLIGARLPFAVPVALAQEASVAEGSFDPNIFLKISADNTVTLISKHFEMGQGVTTGLATLVAEELGAEWAQMRFEFAPNNTKLYANLVYRVVQGTGGSTSTAGAFDQMRQVGAAARIMFIAAASMRWNVPEVEITVEGGVVRHGTSERRASFGELAIDAMHQSVPTQVTLKDPSKWILIGRKLPRLDAGAKSRGAAVYAMDVRRPGMVTAVLQRPDRFGAKAESFDSTAAKRVPGVIDVIEVPYGVAVIARDTWSAMRGRAALKVLWRTDEAETRSTPAIFDDYRRLMANDGTSAKKQGDAKGKLAMAAQVYEAEFTFPYLAHCPMEPLNAVMELTSGGVEIWSGCQLQSIDEFVAATVLGLKPEQVRIHTLLGGGSFGRRGSATGDWIAELAAVTKAYGKAPVHLVWTREDDVRGGYYRPMALHKVKVGLDGNGRICGWQHKIATKSIFTGTAIEKVMVRNGIDESSVEGVVDTPYDIPDFAVDSYSAVSPVPVSWFRSVGHSHSAYVMETVVDELAYLSKRDPVAFRLALLGSQSRDAAVVKMAADKAGWGEALPRGRGRGIAYHASFGTRIAMVAQVDASAGSIKVERIVAAVDCGIPVNPDVIVAQVEGAIGFSLSAALRNQITLSDGVVQQDNFDSYEPTRIHEMPKVEVYVMPSRERPTGIGEPGVPPVAPSIGNAIFSATGKRLRALPLLPPQKGIEFTRIGQLATGGKTR